MEKMMTQKKSLETINPERHRREVLRRAEDVIAQGKVKRAMTKPALVARNILHLLDLKMAGHSPTRTEFFVPGGR